MSKTALTETNLAHVFIIKTRNDPKHITKGNCALSYGQRTERFGYLKPGV